MRGRLLKVGGYLLAVGMVASCLLFLPPMLGISGAGEMEIRETTSDPATTARGMLLLAEPAFAQEGQQAGITFLEKEAGISAYTNLGREINLDKAKTGLQTIDRQTDEYVIGRMGLPGGSPGTEAVHVYVHKTGWAVAYYWREHPAARIIDWNNPAVTKLEQALEAIAAAAGVPLGEVKHYDFRFPDAEKLMVIIDNDGFRLKIPADFTVYERSFSFWADTIYVDTGGWLTIDGKDIVRSRGETRIGTLTAHQLRPGVFCTVGVKYEMFLAGGKCNIAIVLVYAER